MTTDRITTLETQLQEALELLEHFRYIAHGPGCDCEWCVKRDAFMARTHAGAVPQRGTNEV